MKFSSIQQKFKTNNCMIKIPTQNDITNEIKIKLIIYSFSSSISLEILEEDVEDVFVFE